MNETPPPFEPQKPDSKPVSEKYTPPPRPPSFALMFFLGILLIVGGTILCLIAQTPAPLGLAALAAFFSVFFDGYRGIFVGFVSTIGVLLLAVAIICGAMGVPNFH